MKKIAALIITISFFSLFNETLMSCPSGEPRAWINHPGSETDTDVYITTGTTLQFNGSLSYHTDPNREITGWKWVINDQDNGFQYSPTYSYYFHLPGTYYLRLIVRDDEETESTNDDDYSTRTIHVLANSPPVIANSIATDIDRISAVVHGELLDVDSDDTSCTVKVCWGTEFKDILDDWDEVQTVSENQTIGNFSKLISHIDGDFEPGKLHYYRFHAKGNITNLEGWAGIEDPNCFRFVSPPGPTRHYPAPGKASESNLIAHWEFEGDATDSVGGNDGVAYNISWEDGVIGQAASFSGSGNLYGVPQSSFIEIVGSGTYNTYSICFWFQTDYLWSWNKMFCDSHAGGLNTAGRPEIGTGAGGGYLYLATKGGNKDQWIVSEEKYNDGNWHHVVGTVDTSTNIAQLYADGNLIAETDIFDTYPLILDNSYPGGYTYQAALNRCEIGSRTVVNKYFTGKIDDLRIYDRILTSQEVGEITGTYIENMPVSAVLRWIPGQSDYPIYFDVYFGTDAESVLNADHDCEEYRGRISMPSYRPGRLSPHTNYFWRIDSIVLDPYNNYAERITKGNCPDALRAFTTGESSPTNVYAYSGDNTVYLIWDMPDDSNIAHYNIYRWSGSHYSQIGYTTARGFKDTYAFNGTQYQYVITAVNNDSVESVYSEVVYATPHPNGSNYIFVDAEGVLNGDGSVDNPYRRIGDAVYAANSNDVVVIRKGIYDDEVNTYTLISDTITIQGENPSDWDTVKQTQIVNYGMEFVSGSPTLKGVTFRDANINPIIINNSNGNVFIEQCLFENNVGWKGGAIHITDSVGPSDNYISNCKFISNIAEGGYGGAIYSLRSRLWLTNCLFSGNFATNSNGDAFGDDIAVMDSSSSGSMHISSSTFFNTEPPSAGSSDISVYMNNSRGWWEGNILWSNRNTEVFLENNSTLHFYSGCIPQDGIYFDATSTVDINAEYVLHVDPKLDSTGRLRPGSPCIDSVYLVDSLPLDVDIDNNPRVQNGVQDIGAHEYLINSVPYMTSFLMSQGFEHGPGKPVEVDGWNVSEGGSASISKTYPSGNGGATSYQYLAIGSSTTYSRDFLYNNTANKTLRISCIPSDNSLINIVCGQDVVASVKFDGQDKQIYVLSDNTYIGTDKNYEAITAACRNYLDDDSIESYENAWIEFEITLDWQNQSYDVSWKHIGAIGGEILFVNAGFNQQYDRFTRIELVRDASYGDAFALKRVAVSDTSHIGGFLGEDKDIWISEPLADMANPLMGHVPIIGTVWYHRLGEYVIKACPVNDYADPPQVIVVGDKEIEIDPWMIVTRGSAPQREGILGYWNTMRFYSGDYYLKLEVYDDLGRLIAEETKTKTLVYDEGNRSKEVFIEYPIVGKSKGQTYHYEERPDITINWPGSFPFEFKRTYNDSLKNQVLPLFFGWTHNHNIRIFENCSTDWQIDASGAPQRDGNGLGIGKLWLCMPLGGQLYQGYVVPENPNVVKYVPIDMKHLALDQHRDYILREVTHIDQSEPNAVISLQYTHYAPDGMKMVFEKSGVELPYDFPETEGVVDWMAYIGIKRQEDRFGNALEYTWDANNQYLREISNNQTENKIIFRTFEDDYDWELPVLRRLQIASGDETPRDVIYFSVFPHLTEENWFLYQYQKVRGDGQDITDLYFPYHLSQPAFPDPWDRWNLSTLRHTLTYEDQYIAIHSRPHFGTSGPIVGHKLTDYLFRDENGAVRTKFNPCGTRPRFLNSFHYLRRYENKTDEITGNSINTTKYYAVHGHFDGNRPWSETGELFIDNPHPRSVMIREEIHILSPEGTLIKEKTITNKAHWMSCDQQTGIFTDRDPNTFYGVFPFVEFSFYAGEGGVRNYEYYYEDGNFPDKPTTIVEYLDEKGDGENETAGRVFANIYDDYGNVIQVRIYIDSERFILTDYEYHQRYNFPVRKVSWQGYCQEDSFGTITTTGARIEEHYLYGDPNGLLEDEGYSGNYLVQTRALLDDGTSPEQWAIEQLYYLPNGQMKAKVDAEDRITYLVYDVNGYPINVWEGATLAGSLLDGTEVPLGDPQKRYYHDKFGYMVLEANYLGQVQFYVRDYLGRIIESRVYEDPYAVNLTTNFVPESYDPDVTDSNDGNLFKFKERFGKHNYNDQYLDRRLPYGGKDNEHRYDLLLEYQPTARTIPPAWCYEGVTSYGYRDDDKTIVTQMTQYGYSPNGGRKFIWHIHDSLNRPLHIYEHCSGKNLQLEQHYDHITRSEFVYHPSGQAKQEKVYNVRFIIDEDGSPIYDPNSMMVLHKDPVLLKFEEYQYDAMDRMTSKIVHTVEEDSHEPQTIHFGSDAVGNQIYVIDPKGSVIFMDYDNANRKVADYFAVPANLVSYHPDDSLDIETTKDLHAKLREYTEYYLDNKVKSKTQYDHDGITVLAVSEFLYDSRGRIQTVKQLIKDNDADGQISVGDHVAETNYYYSDTPSLIHPMDSSGCHILIEDAESKMTGIRLSYHGKPEKIIYPSGDYEEYIYYDNGLLEKKAVWIPGDTEPYHITYEYNEYGKITKTVYPCGGSLEYEYTPRILGEYGKIKKITDKRHSDDRPGGWGSTYLFEYDPAERLLSYTNQDGFTFNYDYNTAYNRVHSLEVLSPSDEVVYAVRYDYDLAGRLRQVNDMKVPDPNFPIVIATLDYDDNGNRSGLTYHLDGDPESNLTYSLTYAHSPDNFLQSIITSAYGCNNEAHYAFDAWSDDSYIDGLGRLCVAQEIISIPDESTTQQGISLWWRFEECQGTTAYDSISGNHGQIYGAERVSGKIGGGLVFSGLSGYDGDFVKIDNFSDLLIGPDYTVSWWVKPQSLAIKELIILGNDFANHDFEFYQYHGNLRIRADYGSGYDIEVPGVFVAGQWVHICVVGDINGTSVYINGVLSGFTGVAKSSTYGYSLCVGAYPDGQYGFNGVIDEVRVMGYALSSNEVALLFQNSSLAFVYEYDMMSQLTGAAGYGVGGYEYVYEQFDYTKDGNINQYTRSVKEYGYNPSSEISGFGYVGDLMTGATGDNPFTLNTDWNGNTTKLPTDTPIGNDIVEFNWDNKIRKASKGIHSIHVKYDPMGNRVYKRVEDFSDPQNPAIVGEQKFLVDINSQLPVVLCVVDAVSPNLLASSYVYADAQVLCQRHHDPVDPNFYDASYYAHDRLGSVRLVVVPEYDQQQQAWVVRAANSTTYTPFGQLYEGQAVETLANPWKFTGQWHDVEIDQYHLRARQYDPAMMRFTSRDPIVGKSKQPLTLHKYIYTANDPLNHVDLTGESMAAILVEPIMAGYSVHGFATSVVALGVAKMDWDIMSFGIELEKTILPVMALSVVMRKGSYKDPFYEDFKPYFDGMNSNLMGGGSGGNWGWPKWAALAGGVALLSAQIRGCDDVLRGFRKFDEFLDDLFEPENSRITRDP